VALLACCLVILGIAVLVPFRRRPAVQSFPATELTGEEEEILTRLNGAAASASPARSRPPDFEELMVRLCVLPLKGIRPREQDIRRLVGEPDAESADAKGRYLFYYYWTGSDPTLWVVLVDIGSDGRLDEIGFNAASAAFEFAEENGGGATTRRARE
jgi:hypothetical protein